MFALAFVSDIYIIKKLHYFPGKCKIVAKHENPLVLKELKDQLNNRKRMVVALSQLGSKVLKSSENNVNLLFEFSSDDSIADPDFVAPSDSSLSSVDQDNDLLSGNKNKDIEIKEKHALQTNACTDPVEELSVSERLSSDMNLNICNLEVPTSSSKTKQNCCLYCKKLITKLPRHLESRHATENEVQKFINLKKGTPERATIIEKIRNKGNFIYNTDSVLNTGKLIVVRRPQDTKNRNTSHFRPCPKCKQMYSILSLRKHYRICSPESKGRRNCLINSRKVQLDIHPKASFLLRNEVFPVLRDDDITNIIRFDELVIIFGNKQTEKYRHKHQFTMIRSRLRAIGRFLLEFKKMHPRITDLASIYHPIFFDDVVKTINIVAGLNESLGKYKAPSTAYNLGNYLKVISNYLLSECIKNQDSEKKKQVLDFQHLMTEGFTTVINRTVQENQEEHYRQKKVVLPTDGDIKLLRDYLTRKRRLAFQDVSNNFTFEKWKELASFTLISIQVFNRRRAGELERILIEDYKNHMSLNKFNKDVLNDQSTSVQLAEQYVRFTIRGKKGRTVPVLLNKEFVIYIDYILKTRTMANVPSDNPYVFGLPGKGRNYYVRACPLMAKYSIDCGAKKPSTLRGTELRKHIATKCSEMELQDNEIRDLANFLGHHEKIHMEHYRMPIIQREINIMSKLLEKAQGAGEISENHNFSITSESPNNTQANISGCSTSSGNLLTNFVEECDGASPNYRIKRKSWSTPEKSAVKKIFQHYLQHGNLPSISFCEDVINETPALQKRSANQLKIWIHNEIKKKSNGSNSSPQKKGRVTWTTPERHTARMVFKKNLMGRYLPKLKECAEAIKKYPALQTRKPEQLKAFINNEIRKTGKQKCPILSN